MAAQLPEEVYIYICTIPPDGGTSPFPTGCDMRGPFKSSLLQESGGYTKEQYDALFGAVMMIVCLIIAISLIKKAIEQ